MQRSAAWRSLCARNKADHVVTRFDFDGDGRPEQVTENELQTEVVSYEISRDRAEWVITVNDPDLDGPVEGRIPGAVEDAAE